TRAYRRRAAPLGTRWRLHEYICDDPGHRRRLRHGLVARRDRHLLGGLYPDCGYQRSERDRVWAVLQRTSPDRVFIFNLIKRDTSWGGRFLRIYMSARIGHSYLPVTGL